MIKANELRIGNIVHVDGLHGNINLSVSAITQKATLQENRRVIFFKQDKEKAGEFLEDCYPIPLTSELLINCGFKDDQIEIGGEDDMWLTYHDNYHFTIYNRGGDGKMPYQIKYLHQLQNLYFALTGEELEINFAL